MGVITVWEEREMWQRVISRDLNALHVYFYMHLLESELPKIPTDQSRCCHWLDRFSFVHMSAPTSPQLKQWWWKCSKTLWGYKLDYHPLLWPHTHTHTHIHTHTPNVTVSSRLSLASPFFLPLFFFHQSPSYPESESVCLENIYFDLFFFIAPWMHCSCEQSCVSLIMKQKGETKGERDGEGE